MKLYYDCETSGLPEFKLPSHSPSQPWIVQLSAILKDDEGKEVAVFNRFIKPFNGFKLPAIITELTGITQQQIDEGEAPSDVMRDFWELYKRSDLLIAHNESFDGRMVRIMLYKILMPKLAEDWESRKSFCTMLACTPIMKMPPTIKMVRAGFTKFKSPKLQEAYKFFHDGQEFEGAHDALNDVRACIAVHGKLAA